MQDNQSVNQRVKELELVRSITDAPIPLEAVAWEEYEDLRRRPHQYVWTRQFISSADLLLTEKMTRCQCIIYASEDQQIGALAHLGATVFDHSRCYPNMFLTGRWADRQKSIEDPRAIFTDLGQVIGIHIYHEDMYYHGEREIDAALKGIGIARVVHIPVKADRSGRHHWIVPAYDVVNKAVYSFPDEFKPGIRFKPFEHRLLDAAYGQIKDELIGFFSQNPGKWYSINELCEGMRANQGRLEYPRECSVYSAAKGLIEEDPISFRIKSDQHPQMYLFADDSFLKNEAQSLWLASQLR